MATAVMPTLAARLRAIVGNDGVLDSRADRIVYERDASLFERGLPELVVFPRTNQHAAEIVRLCGEQQIRIVARGAGTGRVGGCVAQGGVVLATTRMRKIVEINVRNRYALVESGVVPAVLNARLLDTGLMFAPDPLSSAACTVGGCIATNACGPRSLKYGDTRAHVLGVEVILVDGQIAHVGGPPEYRPGPDLLGAMVGGEGSTGIITKAWLRLSRRPMSRHVLLAMFPTLAAAWETGQKLLASEIGLSALELLDRLVLDGLAQMGGSRFPTNVQAVLLVELDGVAPLLPVSRERLTEICRLGGAQDTKHAQTSCEQEAFWTWRGRAVAAIRRLSPTCWVQDVAVPRWQIAEAMRRFTLIGQEHQIRVAQIAHVGTGCLHPILLFDEHDVEQTQRALATRDAILAYCLSSGGVIRGEHGIGREKALFASRACCVEEQNALDHLRAVFNPADLLGAVGQSPPGTPLREEDAADESVSDPHLAECKEQS